MEAKVLIVGAGPYGLGIAQALWEKNVEVAVVGEPFELWYDHTLNDMRLRSDHNSSEIYSTTGRYSVTRFLAEKEGLSHPKGNLDVATYRRYLDDVVERLPFSVERDRVNFLGRSNGHFKARLEGGGELRARGAVLATGIGAHRYYPEELLQISPERLVHSWETQRIEATRDQRVLVVGSGQSAAEAVETLRHQAEVVWALRHEPFFHSEPLRLPTPLFKLLLSASAIYYRLPHVARKGLARAFFTTTITPGLKPAFHDSKVEKVYADAAGLELSENPEGVKSGIVDGCFDAVISSTGYRCTLRGLDFLDPGLRHEVGAIDRAPRLDADFQSPARGLYMAGGIAEDTYGPVQRFILGSWRAARRIGKALSS